MPHDLALLSREWFEQVWNQRNADAIHRLAHPQVRYQGLSQDGSHATGYDTFKQFRQTFLNAFPDFRGTVEDVLVDGDKTAVRLTCTGTHTGDGLGIPPTGRPFTATAIVIFRWKDGQIVEGWNEFDAAGMMRQLQTPHAKLRP